MKIRVAVALLLLLTSCGSAKASPTAEPEAAATAVATSVAEPLPASPVKDAQAAFPSRLLLTTKDGEILTFSRTRSRRGPPASLPRPAGTR